MKKAKYTIRLASFLIAVGLIIYLNRQTNDNTQSVAEFKVRMFEKVQTDSLSTRRKLERLANDTRKFVDDSSRVREGIHYLTALFAVLVIIELGFLMFEKK